MAAQNRQLKVGAGRLEILLINGASLEIQDGEWWLFSESGEVKSDGPRIADILLELGEDAA